ncbi:MAG: zinc transporter ZntB [Alphaproteobacteria bacterium]
MNDEIGTAGRQAGLRFACVLDGAGNCRELDWDGVRRWQPEDGVLWLHLERNDPTAQGWLMDESGVDSLSCRALLAEESRPRVEDVGDCLMVVLRGVNLGIDDDPDDVSPDQDLVPIHIWAEPFRLISLRDKGHHLIALRDIREALAQGRGPSNTGGLLVKLSEKLVKYAEPIVDQLEASIEDMEDRLHELEPAGVRAQLADVRHAAVELRRYLAPQREALIHLQAEEAAWLTRKNRLHLRECADRVARYVESLDAIRGRATILHEDLTALATEKIAKASHRFSILAAVILPPSLIAGIFGANLGGIPGASKPWAFAILCLIVLVIVPLELWLLKRLKWF